MIWAAFINIRQIPGKFPDSDEKEEKHEKEICQRIFVRSYGSHSDCRVRSSGCRNRGK